MNNFPRFCNYNNFLPLFSELSCKILRISKNNFVNNNTCNFNNWYGVYQTTDSDYNLLVNNTCSSNVYTGIYLTTANNNTLEKNFCNDNGEDGIYIVNTARAELLDADAVLKALDSGKIAGLADGSGTSSL